MSISTNFPPLVSGVLGASLATHPEEETLRDYATCWLPVPTSAQRVAQVEAAALYPSAVAVPLNPPTCPGTMLSAEIPAIKNMDSTQHSLSNIVYNHRAFRCHQQIFFFKKITGLLKETHMKPLVLHGVNHPWCATMETWPTFKKTPNCQRTTPDHKQAILQST